MMRVVDDEGECGCGRPNGHCDHWQTHKQEMLRSRRVFLEHTIMLCHRAVHVIAWPSLASSLA